MRPAIPLPVGDLGLVALYGPPLRDLARPAVLAKQPPHMIGVIVYSELSPNHLGDAIQRPQFVGIPVGDGPFQQQRQQLSALFVQELARTPRHGLGRQRLGPTLGQRLLPTTDRGFRAADAMRHFFHRQPSLQQLDSLPPPVLQRLRRTMWSHASYIGILVTLLLRNAIDRRRSFTPPNTYGRRSSGHSRSLRSGSERS